MWTATFVLEIAKFRVFEPFVAELDAQVPSINMSALVDWTELGQAHTLLHVFAEHPSQVLRGGAVAAIPDGAAPQHHYRSSPTLPPPSLSESSVGPPSSAHAPAELVALMERCWATQPADRPAFREIARRLKAVAVRHGTIVPTTSSTLPLGPEARGSESSAHSSFSDEREDPRGKPVYTRKAHLYT